MVHVWRLDQIDQIDLNLICKQIDYFNDIFWFLMKIDKQFKLPSTDVFRFIFKRPH